MSARIKLRAASPYGGLYELNLPEKGMVGKGATFDALLDSIRAWRRANAFVIGLDFEAEVEREICERFSGECIGHEHEFPRTQTLSLDSVIAGTRLMVKLKTQGMQPVSEEVANQRAATCSQCPLNLSFPRPCGFFCGELKAVVESIVGAKKTAYDDRIRSCSICGCIISAAVWTELLVQQSVLSEDQKSAFRQAGKLYSCWKAEGL